VSHQTRRELAAFASRSISPGAAPEWIDKLITTGATVLVVVQPAGWVGEWHENPKPQWIVPLSGRWFVETMDGTRVEMGPGEASFGNDQHCRPDARGRKGHRSGTVGKEPSVMLIVQLDQDPAAGRTFGLKQAGRSPLPLGQTRRLAGVGGRPVRRTGPGPALFLRGLGRRYNTQA
jgi:hypothetical protein